MSQVCIHVQEVAVGYGGCGRLSNKFGLRGRTNIAFAGLHTGAEFDGNDEAPLLLFDVRDQPWSWQQNFTAVKSYVKLTAALNGHMAKALAEAVMCAYCGEVALKGERRWKKFQYIPLNSTESSAALELPAPTLYPHNCDWVRVKTATCGPGARRGAAAGSLVVKVCPACVQPARSRDKYYTGGPPRLLGAQFVEGAFQAAGQHVAAVASADLQPRNPDALRFR